MEQGIHKIKYLIFGKKLLSLLNQQAIDGFLLLLNFVFGQKILIAIFTTLTMVQFEYFGTKSSRFF